MSKKAETVPSPCIAVCSIDAQTGYCKGCYRTLEEVAGWAAFDNATKRQVLEALEQRKANATPDDSG